MCGLLTALQKLSSLLLPSQHRPIAIHCHPSPLRGPAEVLSYGTIPKLFLAVLGELEEHPRRERLEILWFKELPKHPLLYLLIFNCVLILLATDTTSKRQATSLTAVQCLKRSGKTKQFCPCTKEGFLGK